MEIDFINEPRVQFKKKKKKKCVIQMNKVQESRFITVSQGASKRRKELFESLKNLEKYRNRRIECHQFLFWHLRGTSKTVTPQSSLKLKLFLVYFS